MDKLKAKAKMWYRYQTTSFKRVKLEYRWSDSGGSFYINSQIGQIQFRPRNEADLFRFRDQVINKVDLLKTKSRKGYDIKKELRELYKFTGDNFRARYRANLRTRVENCNFGIFI
jgi:hypothetical protein